MTLILLLIQFYDVAWLRCSRGKLILLLGAKLVHAAQILRFDLGQQPGLLQLDFEHRLQDEEPRLVNVVEILILFGLLAADFHCFADDVVEADDLGLPHVFIGEVLGALREPSLCIPAMERYLHYLLVPLGLLLSEVRNEDGNLDARVDEMRQLPDQQREIEILFVCHEPHVVGHTCQI